MSRLISRKKALAIMLAELVSPDAAKRPAPRKKIRPFIDLPTETARASSGNFRLFSTPGASKTVHPFGNSSDFDNCRRNAACFLQKVA